MALLARARELEGQGRSIIHRRSASRISPRPGRYAMRHQGAGTGRGVLHAAPGIDELRRAIAGYYRTRYGVEVQRAHHLTTGASAALMLACAALVDPGARC